MQTAESKHEYMVPGSKKGALRGNTACGGTAPSRRRRRRLDAYARRLLGAACYDGAMWWSGTRPRCRKALHDEAPRGAIIGSRRRVAQRLVTNRRAPPSETQPAEPSAAATTCAPRHPAALVGCPNERRGQAGSRRQCQVSDAAPPRAAIARATKSCQGPVREVSRRWFGDDAADVLSSTKRPAPCTL